MDKLDTSDVLTMVLDIDHSFESGGAENERDAALNLMDDLFVGLTAMKPSNLLTLKLRLDDRMGLTSTDVHTINQKVATFRAAQDPPFPSLTPEHHWSKPHVSRPFLYHKHQPIHLLKSRKLRVCGSGWIPVVDLSFGSNAS